MRNIIRLTIKFDHDHKINCLPMKINKWNMYVYVIELSILIHLSIWPSSYVLLSSQYFEKKTGEHLLFYFSYLFSKIGVILS